MADKLDPSKVTKPIQLLAAWLAGLVLINGAFLGTAAHISRPEWASGVLVVAAILNVPLFLACLFLLQTRFRPEMQGDEYYAMYLERRFSAETGKSELVEISEAELDRPQIQDVLKRPRREPASPRGNTKPKSGNSIAINDLLPSYEELRSELKSAGIKISQVFGSNSLNPHEPSPFIISVTDFAEISLVKKIVKISAKYGLKGIGYSEFEAKKIGIYVGSYAYTTWPHVKFTKEVGDIIGAQSFGWTDLRSLFSKPDVPVIVEERRKKLAVRDHRI